MKKYLVMGVLALSTMSFAWGGQSHNNNDNYNGCTQSHSFFKSHNNTDGNHRQNINLTQAQQQMFKNYEIQISEKEIQITKIQNSGNVDWNQIERLNRDIAEIKAKINTERMQIEYQNN